MPRLLSGCGGFLLAVVWMDLMFDVQVRGQSGGALPEPVLASIASYYARVTTEAYPMGRLIGAVMLVMLAGTAYQLVRGRFALGLRAAAALCAVVPISLALLRTLPAAVSLGSRSGSPALQSEQARGIYRDHVVSALGMALFLSIQLGAAERRRAVDEPAESG